MTRFPNPACYNINLPLKLSFSFFLDDFCIVGLYYYSGEKLVLSELRKSTILHLRIFYGLDFATVKFSFSVKLEKELIKNVCMTNVMVSTST